MPWWKRLRFLPLALAGAIAVFWAFMELNRPAEVAMIESIHVTRPPSMTIDASSLVGGDAYDFYIKVKYVNQAEHELPTFEKTLIGNGLTWELPFPVAAKSIREVTLWDEDLMGDDSLDRVTFNGETTADGQRYRFELKSSAEADQSNQPMLSGLSPIVLWSLISGAGVFALVMGMLFIRDQAID